MRQLAHLERHRQFKGAVAGVTSCFILVAFLVQETLVWSPPAVCKHLELICFRLGKNCCQQFTTTYKSFMADELYLSSLTKDPNSNLKMGRFSLMRAR